jgi:hypothetical protein
VFYIKNELALLLIASEDVVLDLDGAVVEAGLEDWVENGGLRLHVDWRLMHGDLLEQLRVPPRFRL